MGGYEYTRITAFHILWLVAVAAGLYLGLLVGQRCCGTVGLVFGGIIGLVVGHIVGIIPQEIVHRLFFRQLKNSTNEQLWKMVAKEEWKFDNTMALLQLGARDVDVNKELPRVISMLESESMLTRRYGWDALRIVFTEQYKVISDYDPRGALEDCRAKVAKLRARAVVSRQSTVESCGNEAQE